MAGKDPLRQAFDVSEHAARAGFDWENIDGPRAKVDEELVELDEALRRAQIDAVEDELGDLLFSIVNLARHAGVDPSAALDRATAKFTSRFARVRALGDLHALDAATLDRAWNQAKED